LNRHQYPTITALESDLKRMVSNAKFFNEKSSLVFADAERIRKILSNNMPKINPAYKDPKYVAFPTPLPDEPTKNSEDVADGQDSDSISEAAAASTSQRGTPRTGDDQISSSPPFTGDHSQPRSFEGDSLQDAQDRIISEMIHLRDPKLAHSLLHDPSMRIVSILLTYV
jgi:chromatin structure-remodeling complex subunit RSC4